MATALPISHEHIRFLGLLPPSRVMYKDTSAFHVLGPGDSGTQNGLSKE